MDRQYYLWTAGGSAIAVAIASDVIHRLRQAAETADGAEIGGILLGSRESDDRITVEDFDLLPSEHRRGVTFTLSQADRKKLEQRLRATDHGLQSVGSFRTHLRQGLYMDQYDFDLMSTHFAAPSDVMLLFRPNDWEAGLFVWEEGDIRRQKSYLEFPFDPAVLPVTLLAADPVTGQIAEPQALPAAEIAVPDRKRAIALGFRPFLPTLVKVGLVAATLGLVGVLAFYAVHEHHSQPTVASDIAKLEPATSQALPVPTNNVNAPVEPDISQPHDDLSEMHVKILPPETRPLPFGTPPRGSRASSPSPAASSSKSVPQHAEDVPQPAMLPMPLPPSQSAANLPSSIAPLFLKPAPPPVVPVVSLEPAEPGIVSRSINHVPVLNLLQRHTYRAGDKFSPARPLRQVKPRLPSDLQRDSGYPLPVDVKVWIDKSGQVTKAELLSDSSEPEVGDIAANAALKWTFEPARLADRPVASEMVMHFRFAPKQSY